MAKKERKREKWEISTEQLKNKKEERRKRKEEGKRIIRKIE